MAILRLHPLAQCEVEARRPRFIDTLFRAGFKTGISDRLGPRLAERIAAGGYPAALARRAPLRRVNVADLSAPFELTRPTIHEYVTLLERVLLLEQVPPWHTNRLNRLVKRPKLHMGDTGVACALLGIDAPGLDRDRQLLGSMLESFVLQELRRQASWRPEPLGFFHFRDRDDFEVDIVLEQGQAAVAGVEVKAAATAGESDFRGLRKLRNAAGKRFVAGVVLYDGTATVDFHDGLFAVPVRRLWEAA